MSTLNKKITAKEISNFDKLDVYKVTQKPDLNNEVLKQLNQNEKARMVWIAAIHDYILEYNTISGGWSGHAIYIANLCKINSEQLDILHINGE